MSVPLVDQVTVILLKGVAVSLVNRARSGAWSWLSENVLTPLRHSDLTHEAEDGARTPMLLARSRPGVDAVRPYVAYWDPAAWRCR